MSNMNQIKDGKIRDVDIRLKFIERNLKFFEQPGFEFVNEFGINSTNIIDLAAFDPIFYGFEIKSEKDNTKRLYNQLNAYITFFQIIYVVVHKKLLDEVIHIVYDNRQFNKIGIIGVNSNLEFNEVKTAQRYKPNYSLFIKNLDLEELRALAIAHNMPSDSSKQVLLSRVRRHVTLPEIYEGIKDKLYKYFVWECPRCHSKLYYNRGNRAGKQRVCYKCGHKVVY